MSEDSYQGNESAYQDEYLQFLKRRGILLVDVGARLQRTEERPRPKEGPRKRDVMELLEKATVIEVDKGNSSDCRLLIRRDDNPTFPFFDEMEEHPEGGTLVIPSSWLTERYFRVM